MAAHIVITVHGIRTFGRWQERLTDLLKKQEPTIQLLNYKYGYFSVIGFLIPFLRWIVTRRFRQELKDVTRRHPAARVDIVAHSFGTHLVGWGLLGIAKATRPRIHTIILAGSVLKSTFPWGELLNEGTVRRLINECGCEDWVLVANQAFVLFSGMAGRLGFIGMMTDRFINNWYTFGHGGYFFRHGQPNDDFMTERWLPLLTTEKTLPQVDERREGTGRGLVIFVLQNAEPIKLAAYASPFIILALVFYGLYTRAEAERQIALARQLAAESQLLRDRQPSSLPLSMLLAVESLRRRPTFEGHVALSRALALSAPLVAQVSHPAGVRAVGFDADGSRLAAIGDDRSAKIWDVSTWTEIPGMVAKPPIATLTFSRDGRRVATASPDGSVWIWEGSQGAAAARITAAPGPTAIAFGPDGLRAATLADNFTALLWDATRGSAVPLKHDGGILSLAFSPDGRWVISGGYDHTARVWSVEPRPTMARVNHNHPVSTVAMSHDTRRLVLGDTFGTVRVWALKTAHEVTRMQHGGWVTATAFSPDGRWIATASKDRTARVWDADNGREVARLVHEAPVTSVAFSANNRSVASGSEDGQVRIWNVAAVKQDGKACAVAFNRDGRWLAIGDTYGNTRIWDMAGRRPIEERQREEAEPSAILAVAFDDKAGSVMSVDDEGRLRTWGVGKRQKPVVTRHVAGESMAFSADGRVLAIGTWDGTATVIERPTGRELVVVKHEGGVLGVAISAERRLLATAGEKAVRLWDWGRDSGAPVAQIPGAGTVAFGPDGRWLASAGSGNTVTVWDWAAGEAAIWFANDAPANVAAFSADGRWLVTGSADGAARVWDWARGQKVGEIQFAGPVCAVALSPDGMWLAAGSDDQTVRVSPLTAAGLMKEACVQLTRSLTDEEWRRYVSPERRRETCGPFRQP